MSELDHAKRAVADEGKHVDPVTTSSDNRLPPTAAAICPTFKGKSPSESGFEDCILGMGQVYGLEAPDSKAGLASLFFGLALGMPGKAYQDLVRALDGWKLVQRNWLSSAKVLEPLIMATRLLLHGSPVGRTIAELIEDFNKGTHHDNQLLDRMFKSEVTALLKKIEAAFKAVQEERLKK